MRIVRHQPGVVRVASSLQLRERREIAVHGEHAVGDDQRMIVLVRDARRAVRARAPTSL